LHLQTHVIYTAYQKFRSQYILTSGIVAVKQIIQHIVTTTEKAR